MKKRLLSAIWIFTVLCLFSTPALSDEIKIGIIDTSKIVSNSKAGREARRVLSKEIETRQSAFGEKEESVKVIKEELASIDKDNSAAEYKKKNKEYTEAIKNLSRLKTDMEDELKAINSELSQEILTELSVVVSEFCKKEKYTLILENKKVAAFDGAVDITDKIIKLYDATQDAVK